jgi:hypothetical protein
MVVDEFELLFAFITHASKDISLASGAGMVFLFRLLSLYASNIPDCYRLEVMNAQEAFSVAGRHGMILAIRGKCSHQNFLIPLSV